MILWGVNNYLYEHLYTSFQFLKGGNLIPKVQSYQFAPVLSISFVFIIVSIVCAFKIPRMIARIIVLGLYTTLNCFLVIGKKNSLIWYHKPFQNLVFYMVAIWYVIKHILLVLVVVNSSQHYWKKGNINNTWFYWVQIFTFIFVKYI